VILFGVKFCYLHRNSEEAFRSKHIHMIRMCATIMKKHMFSWNRRNHFDQTHPFSEHTHLFGRNGLSPNRHIHSVGTRAIISNGFIYLPYRHIHIPLPI